MSLSSLSAAALLLESLRPFDGPADVAFAAIITAVPLGAAVSIWVRRLAPQLAARALLWSVLLLGAVMATMSGPARPLGAGIAVLVAAALLLAGRTGLDEGSGGRFQPVAFRGTLILALVLAMADTASFVWCGMAALLIDGHASVLLLVAPMFAGVVGLLRLRTWGLIVSLASNLTVAALALTRMLPVPDPFRILFVATAGVQLLVPLPMIVTIVLGRVPAPDRWRRAKVVASTAVIVAIAAASVVEAVIHRYPRYWF
jgi:hypothetical protein